HARSRLSAQWISSSLLGFGLGWRESIVLILISGYRHASRAFQFNPDAGSLMLTYVATATFYNITEAGFRLLSPSWIFLLVAVVGASGISAGCFGKLTQQVS